MTNPKADVELRHYAGHEFSVIRNIVIDTYRETFGHESIIRFGRWNGTVNDSTAMPP